MSELKNKNSNFYNRKKLKLNFKNSILKFNSKKEKKRSNDI
jgi:hypothetical protein